ncbi:mRNA interferase RelE/StbE [Nocardia pseudobrasiliensis]|uniref:mRNA interferase RelE/StbE n=2 Tax=Nocardia pseudobrasiliensis TaxID=45979 RepID=A0A370I6B9_9NOCA|nr:type II toxin-antitoxin system RelE/ParE family toxin [Nocardia pseudobrasiliensis]RDI66283.1 mRNA interferase RelE/StbE [Nocardia pseudobrasiliensis]
MRIEFHPEVLKQLQRLPREAFGTALRMIIDLADDPRPAGVKKIVGRPNDWRIRFGQYRIVYSIDDKTGTITVFVVAKRSDAYR